MLLDLSVSVGCKPETYLDDDLVVGLLLHPKTRTDFSSRNFKSHSFLNSCQVIQIFRTKQANALAQPKDRISATCLSRAHGVSDKTIRDIWSGRTWLRETMLLDTPCASNQDEEEHGMLAAASHYNFERTPYDNPPSLLADTHSPQRHGAAEGSSGAPRDAIAAATSSDCALTLKSIASLRACKTRAILTDEQAVRIYQIKLDSPGRTPPSPAAFAHALDSRARAVARAFGVSDKAIRDIWKGRTWFRETMHLHPANPAAPAARRLPGRPKGRKPQSPPAAPALAVPAPALRGATLLQGDSAVGGPREAGDERCGGEESPAQGWMEQKQRAQGRMGDAADACCFPSAQSPPPSPPPPQQQQLAVDLAPRPTHPSLRPRGAFGGAPTRDARWTKAAAAFGTAMRGGAGAGLPASSRADDPFHDDWTHW